MPTEDEGATVRRLTGSLRKLSRRPSWLFAGVVTLLVVGGVAVGVFIFDYQRGIIKDQKQAELSTITNLKVAQVNTWLAHRRGDAEALASDHFLARAVDDWVGRGARDDDPDGQLVAERVSSLQRTLHYRGVILLDAAGRTLAAAGDANVDAKERALALAVAASGKVSLTDLYQRPGAGGDHVEFDVFAPLVLPRGDSRKVVGAFYLKVDPRQRFFPLVQAWPTPSPSAETLLVRRDADSVVYLNELRHRPPGGPQLRRPLDDPALAEAMVVRGEHVDHAVFEGLDYRGVPVLAASRKVPGMPWYIVAKVDAAELYAPIRQLEVIVAALEALFVLLIGGGAAFWLRHQQAQFMMRQYQGELERRALAEHLDYLAKYANDIIVLVDAEGRIIDANDRALAAYGYSRDELLGLNVEQLRPASETEILDQARRTAEGHGVVFESVHLRKDGTTFPAETSLRDIEIDGRRFYQGIVRDITERKRAEQALRDSEERLRLALEASRMVAWEWDPAAGRLLQSANAGEIWRRPVRPVGSGCELVTPADSAPLCEASRAALADGKPFAVEFPVRDSGTVRWLEARGRVVGETASPAAGGEAANDPASQPARVSGIVMDVSDRKRAEAELRLAAQVFDSSNEGFMITDADNNIVSVNRAFTEITGYPAAEVIGRNPRLLASGRQDTEGYRALWAAVQGVGRWQGELWNRRKNGEHYPLWLGISTVKDERGRICNHIGIFSDITERKEADERIQFLAHYDTLTRLPNRFLLHERLGQALALSLRYHKSLALLFIDLDRFKAINDTLGHEVGDELLKTVATRLQACVRESETVARLGGDEFLVVLPEIRQAGDAAVVARKIIDALGRPYPIAGHELVTSPSIGISVFPNDGADGSTLIKHADIAMYHAKSQGRNNYQFFTEEMNVRASEKLALENGLRQGLARGELVLHYLPQIDVRDGARQISGAEALLRWRHPELGLLPAARFIGAVESSGLVAAVGEWVLGAACAQGRAWQEAGLPAVRMTVNVSAQHFRQPAFAQTVARVLQGSGLPPHLLGLDLPEAAFMSDTEAAAATLGGLAATGVHLSIDDFGSGLCNLRYLRRFPINTVKLDPSFVHDIAADQDAAAVTGAMIALAQSMKFQVLAEGVETPEQLAQLRAQHCDAVQGFHFGVQLPADEFADLLRQSRQGSVQPAVA